MPKPKAASAAAAASNPTLPVGDGVGGGVTQKNAKVREDNKKKKNGIITTSSSSSSFSFVVVKNVILNLLGLVFCGIVGVGFGYYMCQLHETRLWFSNIKQVEREISFRTEAGLYYSYFKEILAENDLASGISHLLKDKLTEAPAEINILQRMNIYQEIILAFFYKLGTSLGMVSLDSIVFYSYACFALSGFAISAVYLLSWRLSGHFLFGLLTAAWTFADIDDSTRVFFTVNLREIFALPFFWCQNFAIISHLSSPQGSSSSKLWITLWTFAFSLFWQFNQFILFLQSFSLLVVAFIFPKSSTKIIQIFALEIIAFGFLLISQFFQTMLLSSVFLWFNLSSILVLTLFKSSSSNLIKNSIVQLSLITFSTLALSNLIKWLLAIEADSHIWTFVKAKLGLPIDNLPFETALYICHGAFAFIDNGFFDRTTTFGMLPIYCSIVVIVAGFVLKHLITNFIISKRASSDTKIATSGSLISPDTKIPDVKSSVSPDTNSTPERHDFFNEAIIFLVGQSILTGIMAILTLRMKYVWFPQIAVIAAHGFKIFDKWIGKYPKYAIIIGIIWLISTKQFEIYQQQMANEQEFYDPDTVALMEWISAETSPSAIFAGSMQLMAGVKACTSRPISNHPHFEDKSLREKTERIYKIYGKYSISNVHQMCCEESINYLILEDSICLAPAKAGCSTNEIVDNSQMAKNNNNETIARERFCQAVKDQTKEIKKRFKLVFENQTFKIYRVFC